MQLTQYLNIHKALVFLLLLILAPAFLLQALIVRAADDSLAINSVTLTLHDDDDENGIANIGDTIRLVVNLNNTDGACDDGGTTAVTADLSAYGGATDEALACITEGGDGMAEEWRIDFVVVDAGSDNGIDVAANNADSAVEVTVSDDDDVVPETDDSNNMAEAVDTIAPTITDFEVSGGSGADDTFIVGDTVTVTWDNSGDGDNNADTIDSVTVVFFGGEEVEATEDGDIWTATLEIDSIDDLEDTDLNITVTIMDNGGNTASDETDDVDVDNVAPATPVASPSARSFARTLSVSLSSSGSDSIRYTTDDSTPSCSVGTVYAGAFSIDASVTIKAIGCDDAGNASAVGSTEYTLRTGSSGGSPSRNPRAISVPAHASPVAQTVVDLINKNRELFIKAQALGLSLPQYILDVIGNTASSGGPVRDLTLNMSGDDVSKLQTLLMARGHAIAAGATGYFGSQTQAALRAYQSANGVSPATGYFGPITRAHMKAAGLVGIWW